jgi:hypothetical protein
LDPAAGILAYWSTGVPEERVIGEGIVEQVLVQVPDNHQVIEGLTTGGEDKQIIVLIKTFIANSKKHYRRHSTPSVLPSLSPSELPSRLPLLLVVAKPQGSVTGEADTQIIIAVSSRRIEKIEESLTPEQKQSSS